MKRCWQGVLAGALLVFGASAQANGIAVNPIRLELEPGQRTATLTISNETAGTKVLQVTVMRWSQVGGESVYEPARDLIATPVLFRVPPKARQLLRVGFVSAPADNATERTYRVYLNEVAEDKGDGSQIRFLLRLGIPLFVPPAKPQDALDWQLRRQADGSLRLAAENRGNRHVRLQGLRLEDPQGNAVAEQQSLDYLLAGSRLEWVLKLSKPADSPLQLKAQSGRGVIEVKLETKLPGGGD